MSLNVLTAGTDTTASTLSTMLWGVVRSREQSNDPVPTKDQVPFVANTELTKDLRQEQEQLVEKYGPDFTAENAKDVFGEMVNARANILESLRINHPIALAVRTVMEDGNIGGVDVKEGDMFSFRFTPNNHVHPLRQPLPAEARRCPFDFKGVERTQTPHDGFDYNPYRYLQQGVDKDVLFNAGSIENSESGTERSAVTTMVMDAPRQSVPMQPGIKLQPIEGEEYLSVKDASSFDMSFGYGPRNCVGRNLAIAEMNVFIAELFRRYDIEVHKIPQGVKVVEIVPEFDPGFDVKFIERAQG